MSIIAILSDKDTKPQKKLKKVAEIVAVARSKYGNPEAEITPEEVHTAYGVMGFQFLEPDSKVAVLQAEIQRIKVAAIEYCKNVEGAVFDRKVEEMIATSSAFANIAKTTESEYL